MSEETKRAVICLSGGMDSTGLLMHLLARGYQIFGLSFDYGQKHKFELERLANNLEYLREADFDISHRTVDLSLLGEIYHSALTDPQWDVPEGFYEQENMKETVVPNRNAIFCSIAYGYALSLATRSECSVQVALGVHSGDHAIYPDCRPSFYDAIFKAFSEGNWESERVSVYLPYLHGDKVTILQDAQKSIAQLGLDFDIVFRNTNTSYLPDETGRSLGRTGADVERILAFNQLGLVDPVPYVDPWEVVLKRALEYEQQAKEA